MLLAAVMPAEEQKWLNFWTADECWILWVNPPTGSRILDDD
jgi:hypothetical protein